jgi:tetratricopeptide (TPR) repeat protein
VLNWDHLRTAVCASASAIATGPIRIPSRKAPALLVCVFLFLTNCSHTSAPENRTAHSSANARKELSETEKKLAGEQARGQPYWELVLRKSEILEQLDRRDEALDWLRKNRPTDDVPAGLAVRLIRELASIESALDQLQEADRDYQQAIALARSSTQAQMAASLEVRRARVLIKLDEPEKSEEALSRAEDYVRSTGDPWLVPYILHYRGQAWAARNRFEDAIAPLEASLREFQKDKNQPALAAKVMITLASCYYRLGRIDKARSLYQEALRTGAPEDRHLALGHLGNISLDDADYSEAAKYYHQAAQEAKGRDQYYYLRWLENLAEALIEQGDWNGAERSNNEALELEKNLNDSTGLALALVNKGRIESSRGHPAEAEGVLREVAESGRWDPGFALMAYGQLARVFVRGGKPDAARSEMERALALADQTSGKLREDENKLSYLSSLIDLHRQYIGFLMDRKDEKGAFAVAESSRARLLRERLDLPHSQVESYGIAKYQAAARASGATFLAYWIGPERSYLWAISGTGFAASPLPKEAEVRRLVEQYQGAIERGEPLQPGDKAAGARLFEILVPAGVRKPGGRYFIVPDGPLYALNFETLPVAGDRPHYWIEDATLAVAPSLDLLLQRSVPAKSGRSVLLVGDAAEWNPEYPKLLHAQQEMAGIETVFPAVERKVLAGPAATAGGYESAQPGNYAYIHFTAHATANKNSPFDSAIILSRESGGAGGRLEVKEVLRDRLHAELVTISACHSAGARTYWGEGLVGFAWAFLESGAHGVVAGLWDVSDYSSPRLMHDLYAGLAASMSPEDALRAAKLALIRGGKYAEPYYWGAFQLYKGTL